MKSENLGKVSHNFLGRKNGFSSGLFSSLNCSKFVGDNPDSVDRNLNYARESISAKKLLVLKQIHSSACLIVNEKTPSDLEADAMVTKTPGIALGILTADCVPLLFFDSEAKIIGAAHAGWKGAVGGVIESTLEKMILLGASPENMLVVMGPCIHKESYEVSEDFLENFPKKYDSFSQKNNKFYFDPPGYCTHRLLDAGIVRQNIDFVNINTFQNHEDYFSYRYARQNSDGVCGRNISLIRL